MADPRVVTLSTDQPTYLRLLLAAWFLSAAIEVETGKPSVEYSIFMTPPLGTPSSYRRVHRVSSRGSAPRKEAALNDELEYSIRFRNLSADRAFPELIIKLVLPEESQTEFSDEFPDVRVGPSSLLNAYLGGGRKFQQFDFHLQAADEIMITVKLTGPDRPEPTATSPSGKPVKLVEASALTWFVRNVSYIYIVLFLVCVVVIGGYSFWFVTRGKREVAELIQAISEDSHGDR